MGNCCSIKKTKRKGRSDDVYDPDQMEEDHLRAKTKDIDVDSVKAALDQVHNGTEDDLEDEVEYDMDDDDSIDSDESAILARKSKTQPVQKSDRTNSSHNAKAFPKFKKPLSAIPQHLVREGFSRAKHNSTSSLYINSTMAQPNNDEILRCMAAAILYHIEKGVANPNKNAHDIFNEEKFPITKSKVDARKMPDTDTIHKFLSMIFKAERLDSECAIMCLAYIERMITLTNCTMEPINWRRVVLSALILASKVWEDQSVWNVDFLPVFDNLTAQDLNKLERQFLALLQYNVSLSASMYAKYYFELRSFSKLDSEHFPLQPLDKLQAKRLEDHSQNSENRVKNFKRSASVDQLKPANPHTLAVLN